ncbi:hypothetical protein O6H91_20G063200 [Diphasiastrum complanatum]|uniref:Uncharacterized protein n=1 Tax=Diphasiastrum complanatum TaxID=34168 RepID=A0ACC2ARC7_DIPCM|nr:hypothetical protein O6H91_20G063200 [Diphasiastrum complanatum]
MTSLSSSIPMLSDFQWRLGVTAANDEVQAVGSCFLQMMLVLDHAPIYLELSLPEFYQFFSDLETLKAELDNVCELQSEAHEQNYPQS